MSTTTPAKNRLPDHLQKTLAELLESNSGLRSFRGGDNHKLARLLDSQAEQDPVFGLRGDPIRRKIQLQVLEGQQKLGAGTYIRDVLDSFCVRSHENRVVTSLFSMASISANRNIDSVRTVGEMVSLRLVPSCMAQLTVSKSLKSSRTPWFEHLDVTQRCHQ